jgi:tetratricopeptide (TPR) repeat protein
VVRRILALVAMALLSFGASGFSGAAVAQTADDEAALLKSAQAALAAKNWTDAEATAKKLVARSARWDYLKLLGDAEMGNAEYQDAADTYGRAWTAAQSPTASPVPTKPVLGALLTQLGNAYLKLKRTNDAIDAYSRAAPLAANPGLAYFNLCATLYNAGRTETTIAACNKAIDADPGRADAYFIKGSVLLGAATVKDGKTIAPPGTVEALRKYLDLAPDGPHVQDVKAMLDFLAPGSSAR